MSKALQTLAKGSAISFIAMFFLGTTNYLIRRTLALNLSEVEYGFFYAVFSFCSLFLAYLDLGLGQSTVILMSKYCSKQLYTKVNGFFSLAILIKLTCGMVVAVPLLLTAPYLTEHYFNFTKGLPAFYLFCFFIPVSAVAGAISSAYDAKKDFLTKNLLIIIQYAITLCVLVAFISEGKLILAAFAFLFSHAIIFLVGVFKLQKLHSVKLTLKGVSLNNSKELLHLSKWVALSVAGLSTMSHM